MAGRQCDGVARGQLGRDGHSDGHAQGRPHQARPLHHPAPRGAEHEDSGACAPRRPRGHRGVGRLVFRVRPGLQRSGAEAPPARQLLHRAAGDGSFRDDESHRRRHSDFRDGAVGHDVRGPEERPGQEVNAEHAELSWYLNYSAGSAISAFYVGYQAVAKPARIRSSCARWFRSWPAIVSTITRKVMSPRSGCVTGLAIDSGVVDPISARFHSRSAENALSAERAPRLPYIPAQRSWSNGWMT